MTIPEAIDILEVQRGFTEAVLAKAYRHALMVWHPDRFSGNEELIKKAQERTREVIEAYDLLQPMAVQEAPSGQTSPGRESPLRTDSRRVEIVLKSRELGKFTPSKAVKRGWSSQESWIVAVASLLLLAMVAWSVQNRAARESVLQAAAAAKQAALAASRSANAEAGITNAEEQIQRGSMYATGDGVPKSESDAAKWYRKAAEQNNSTAQALLGVSYAEGFGVPKNEAEAITWYRKAANQNDPQGQWLLGGAYEKGLGVLKSEPEAVTWYRKAAEQRNPSGENDLGRMYETGAGIPKDEDEAAVWYRKAAEQNLSSAQYHLGMLYANGKIGMIQTNDRNGTHYTGTHFEKDYVQAHIWLNLAGANGNESARRELATLERTMTPAEKAEAVAKAKELFAKIKSPGGT